MQIQRVTGSFNVIPFAEISPSTSSSYVPFTASFPGKKASTIKYIEYLIMRYAQGYIRMQNSPYF